MSSASQPCILQTSKFSGVDRENFTVGLDVNDRRHWASPDLDLVAEADPELAGEDGPMSAWLGPHSGQEVTLRMCGGLGPCAALNICVGESTIATLSGASLQLFLQRSLERASMDQPAAARFTRVIDISSGRRSLSNR